jgi:hypothetical protein
LRVDWMLWIVLRAFSASFLAVDDIVSRFFE